MYRYGLVKTLLYLEENNLISTFREIAKILKILITITIVFYRGWTFSSLKRIKAYLRNTMGQSRLNSLSVISIGRDLIRKCDSFNIEVMETFINKKERRMHFTYKGKKEVNFVIWEIVWIFLWFCIFFLSRGFFV